MKSKIILIVLIVIGLIAAGRAITMLRQQDDQKNEETVIEVRSEDFEDLNSEILDLIAEIDAGVSNSTQFDDLLSIELFELDPENEELEEPY